MNLASLFATYLLAALFIFLFCALLKRKQPSIRKETTVCSTCGTRYFITKRKQHNRCPQCSALQ